MQLELIVPMSYSFYHHHHAKTITCPSWSRLISKVVCTANVQIRITILTIPGLLSVSMHGSSVGNVALHGKCGSYITILTACAITESMWEVQMQTGLFFFPKAQILM